MSDQSPNNLANGRQQREWVKPVLTEANIAEVTEATNSPDPTDDGGGNPAVDCVPG